MSALGQKQTHAVRQRMSALPPKAEIPVSIDQSCPRRLAVPEQTLAGALAVMELSEPGQASERVFSTLPFFPASPSSSPSSFAPGHRALLSWISSPRSISRIGIMPRRHSHLSSRTHRLTNMAVSIIPKSRSEWTGIRCPLYPPKADMCSALADLCFGPKADIAPAASYSITSSARESSEGGTVNPSALAALRLITSSNFVDCCTGRSAIFSPLRTRAARMPPWR